MASRHDIQILVLMLMHRDIKWLNPTKAAGRSVRDSHIESQRDSISGYFYINSHSDYAAVWSCVLNSPITGADGVYWLMTLAVFRMPSFALTVPEDLFVWKAGREL